MRKRSSWARSASASLLCLAIAGCGLSQSSARPTDQSTSPKPTPSLPSETATAPPTTATPSALHTSAGLATDPTTPSLGASPETFRTPGTEGTWTRLEWTSSNVMAVKIKRVVTWSKGFVALMTSGDLYASTDGELWSLTHGGPTGPNLQLVETNGALVAFSADVRGPCVLGEDCQPPENGTVRVWKSQDGRQWTTLGEAKGLGHARALSIAALASRIVAVVCDSYAPTSDPRQSACVPATSDDGLTWVRHPAVDPSWRPYAVAVSLGIFEIVGSSGIGRATPAAWWSSDGIAWVNATLERVTPDMSGALTRLLTGRGGLIATGGLSSTTADHWWRTRTGKSWELNWNAQPLGETSPEEVGPCANGFFESDGRRFIAGTGSGRGWSSSDGYLWTPFDGTGWADLAGWKAGAGCVQSRTIVVLPRGVATPHSYGTAR